MLYVLNVVVFCCKQKTAYEMRISDWSSDVCSSDLVSIIWRLRQRRPSTRNIKGLGRRDYATVFGRCSRTERDMVPPRYEESDRFHFLSRIYRHLRKPPFRSEEHTSELQSLMRISYAVFCLQKKHIHTLFFTSIIFFP